MRWPTLPTDLEPGPGTVILVGERAALASGTLTAVQRLAERTGARLAWVPRRAGDRGAVEAGCLPNLLPGGRPVDDPAARVDTAVAWGTPTALPTEPGRDTDEMLLGAGDAELGALIVAGVDPSDLLDPGAALEGLEKVGFVISIEARASAVTERADVVLPISLIEERPGTFVNWEGRHRGFDAVFAKPSSMSDLRVLAALADGLGAPLELRTAAQARAELRRARRLVRSAGRRPGHRCRRPGPARRRRGRAGQLADAPRPQLRRGRRAVPAGHRPAAGRGAQPQTAAAAGVGGHVTVSNDHGSITLPVQLAEEMVPGVVWLPARPRGHDVATHLAAAAGDPVTISPTTSEVAE